MNEPLFENIPEPQAPQTPPALSEEAKGARASASRLGLALTAFSLLPTLVAILLYLFVPVLFPAWEGSMWFYWSVQVFAVYVVGLSAFLFILGPAPLPALPKTGERFSGRWYLGFFCMLLFCAFVGSLISSLLAGALSYLRGAPIVDSTSATITSSPLILVFLIAVIIGPIVEELVFRRAVMRTLAPYGEKAAILISGLIFGLAHGNLFQLFYTTAIGILFSYLYARTGKIYQTILMHMAFNFFGGFLPSFFLQLMPLDEWLSGSLSLGAMMESLLPLLGLLFYELLYFGLAIAGLAVFLARLRRARFSPTLRPLTGRERTRVYFLNVGMLSFALSALLLLFLSVF